MLYFAVSIKMVYSQECDDKGHKNNDNSRAIQDEFFMCISASVALIIIFILRMTHKGIWYKGKQVRFYSYLFRFFVALCCSFIPYLTHKPLGTIAILFALTSILILQVCLSTPSPPPLLNDRSHLEGSLFSSRIAGSAFIKSQR
jgi:cell division protein FtsW (lipid II flippase)